MKIWGVFFIVVVFSLSIVQTIKLETMPTAEPAWFADQQEQAQRIESGRKAALERAVSNATISGNYATLDLGNCAWDGPLLGINRPQDKDIQEIVSRFETAHGKVSSWNEKHHTSRGGSTWKVYITFQPR